MLDSKQIADEMEGLRLQEARHNPNVLTHILLTIATVIHNDLTRIADELEYRNNAR